MLAQALISGRHVSFAFGGQGEITVDKTAQIKIALIFLHLPVGKNRCRIKFRHRIRKGFLIREELSRLHRMIKRPKAYIRRLRRVLLFRCLYIKRSRCQRAGDQHRQYQCAFPLSGCGLFRHQYSPCPDQT